MKILVADGYNLLYRARTGYFRGQNPIVFNFIRSFKALVEKFNPDITYFVLEGAPKARLAILPEYKGQRTYSDHDDFNRQRNICIDMLKKYFPVVVVRHEDHECDDVIGALVNEVHKDNDCVVISTDTDFIQLLDKSSDRIRLYNPVKKKFVDTPDYDYVGWKALTGDKSDNIEGFHRIGPATAQKLITSPTALSKFLDEPDKLTKFQTNIQLIRFEDVDLEKIQCSDSKYDGESIRNIFESMEFDSLLNEKYWKNFERVFNGRAEHA